MSHKEFDSLLNKQFSSGANRKNLPPYGTRAEAHRKGSRAEGIRPGTHKPRDLGRVNDYLHCKESLRPEGTYSSLVDVN